MTIDIFNTDKKYNIIYADPPWNFSSKELQKYNGNRFRPLEEALNLMKKWGFKYVTVAFIWSKVTKNGKQVSNLGAWTMKNCEICLFGTKGRMLKYKKSNSVKQLFEAERTAHSKKTDCVRDFIVELFGDIPRIELFARQHADGWDCWGNEV